jgi:hypothetical protein
LTIRAGDARPPSGTQVAFPSAGGGKIPVYRHLRIANLTATCPQAAGLILGLPASCISNVLLENVNISAAKSFVIRNARAIQLRQVSVTVAAGQPFQLENAEVSGLDKDRP